MTASVLILMPDALEALSRSLVAVWTMTANFYFYGKTGYFDAPSAEAPLLHTWSLAVEDQFYLTWPLLLLLLFRRLATRPRMVAAVLALAASSLLYAEARVATDPNAAFFLPLPRAFELLIGCALALGLPLLRLPRRALPLLDLAGLALILGSAFLIHAGTPFPGLSALPAVIGAALLIAAGLHGPAPVARLLSLGPVVTTGRMSYSIYLYHWPILALATYWLGRAPHAAEAAALVALALVLAALSWLLVEQWLTRQLGLYRMAPPALIRRTAVAVAGLFLLAGVGIAGEGLPQRLDPPAYEVYRAASAGNPLRQSCDGYDLAFSHHHKCAFGRALPENGSYDIAIFGDSNADHFVPMLTELAKRAGLAGRQVTQSACAPLIGAARQHRSAFYEDECALYQETILKFLDRNPGLKIAVLSSAWSNYNEALTNRIAEDGMPGERRPFADFAKATIDIFRARGIKVLVIGQIPFFDAFSLRCLADAARRDTEEADCTIPRAAVDKALAVSQEAFRAIAKADPGVTFLDMSTLLCDETLCSAFKDEVLIYRDKNHLNAHGSAYLARYASLPPVGP